ncbi:unnamed protein product [Mesocestoides corti]|uniref:Uncharacterized protein n=2 Tax=Mesocestoides corti TaxID=53468 RepID=A0A0R3U3K2_MESCO|nr:unnamed protein product [Mesocestoides corti]
MAGATLSSHERVASFLGGATAGICVDCAVYPIDTIKTRLQSAAHEVKPKLGGKFGLFAGLPAVLFGSAPGAALFFITYETVKRSTLSFGAPLWMSSMASACAGEVVACIIRVPVETIKQRTQSQPNLNVRIVFSRSLQAEGWAGLYRGYLSQVCRGLPFCLLQYPIWEMLKRVMERHNRLSDGGGGGASSLTKKQFALCGAIAGAIGGSSTTPMDVAKTRIMLAEKGTPLASGNVVVALKTIYREGGVRGLFAGLVPRVCIMSFGGAIFLGLYDITKAMWLASLDPMSPYVQNPPLLGLSVDLVSRERGVQFCAGALAGLCVDVALYPVDTMKTRLQSASRTIFTPCGRLRLFAGLPTVLLGSAPASAVFFYAYELSKDVSMAAGLPMWTSSVIGTTVGDILSMVIWVPCENVKQSAQSRPFDPIRSIVKSYIRHEGWMGLYRGYVSTVIRDLPCAVIQFPVWELLKQFLERRNRLRMQEAGVITDLPDGASTLTTVQFGACGFLSGAVAGSVTTPLDVAKTRIMLAERSSPLSSGRISTALKVIYKEAGFTGWFAGLLPRTGIMSVGGAIFLGLYDICKAFWSEALDAQPKSSLRP